MAVEGDDLAIEDGRPGVQFTGRLSARAGNDLNSLPFREISLDLPLSTYASDRNPSHLISKSHSGWENGSRIRVSGMGWNCGRGIYSNIFRRDILHLG